MEEIRVESWLELQECLYAGSWHEELQRHRSDFCFRGENDARNELTTSLQRLVLPAPAPGDPSPARAGRSVEPAPPGDVASLEQHLLRAFKKYAPRSEVPVDSTWNWLALAKHHNLPTRLLDWSYSPQVALHFVTANAERFDRDGCVWMVDFVRAREHLPGPLADLVAREGGNTFTAEMLGEAANDLRAFDRLGDDFAVFFEPPSLDDRIVNQYALFSLMPDPAARIDRWLEGHPELARRLIIPAGLKWEVRDKLDQANVTERVLFPGLDGLSAWLKRYYSPRRAPGP